MGSLSTSPSLCLIQAFEIVLSLQLVNQSIVSSKLGFSRKILGYWRRNTVFFRLVGCHDGCVDAQRKEVRSTLGE